ncbi:MAG: hypothetical protein NZ810_01830, partial [Dehalococcoidia bacterium]|nr:hypothetical protein [Dehalococcoidia bacterium]
MKVTTKLTTAFSSAAVILLVLAACTESVEEDSPATAPVSIDAKAVVPTATPPPNVVLSPVPVQRPATVPSPTP